MSDRRRSENRERRDALHARFGQYPDCALRPLLALIGITVCQGAAVDGHEISTRGRGGSITDPDNVLPGCRGCHRWVTDHPIEAAEIGAVEASGRR